jgi:hypothetical protein
MDLQTQLHRGGTEERGRGRGEGGEGGERVGERKR